MQIWSDTKQLHPRHSIICEFLHPGDLFLDIETTGLSRSRHPIYLIGMTFVTDEHTLSIQQLFAENPTDEPFILTHFAKLLHTLDIKRIITFNGNSFDLPFLRERGKLHAISLDFDCFALFDIYKEVLRRKNTLQLPNYRQKTIEQFLGICREDKFSGGELIKIYESYVKCPNEASLHLLKLHNYEDVLGMIDLLEIFAYDLFFSAPARVVSACVEHYTDVKGNPAEELIATLSAPCALPGTLSCTQPVSGAYLHVGHTQIRLRVPLYHGMARLYYLDYKNYYYLPEEDMAIHKSVATYVDKAHKEKATPETCYSKVAVTDAFLHSDQITEYITHVLHSFHSSTP